MAKSKWLWIILGMLTGVFSPWQYQIVALVALLMGYASCYSLQWKQFQLLIAYLFGGLATGLGLHILIANASHHQYILMVIQPLLAWLVLRIFFYGVETKYTLNPDTILTQMRAEDEVKEPEADSWQPPVREGTSAWSGDSSGKADIPDAEGLYMIYDFFCMGEIAMGGPTYGDVVFGNKCAFSGVGPSIALSEDGRYAAMTLPSRNEWGVMLVDLVAKKVYQPKENSGFWEIDNIKNGVVHGRFSPLTSNVKREATIQELKAASDVVSLVDDDGWWVLDYPERKPFPTYNVVSMQSQHGTHKVTFVPDLKPHAANPYARMQHPKYIVMVDDVLLNLNAEIGYPYAVWIDGAGNSKVQEGRFLKIAGYLLDFRNAANDTFDVNHPSHLTIAPLDEMTNISLGDFSDAGNGVMAAQGIVMPRSTGFNEAEYESYSTTHPWDDEHVEYWDAHGKQQLQSRSRIQTHMEYRVDLANYSEVQSMRLCTEVRILNRANPDFSAKLSPVSGKNVGVHYSAYTLTTSCGLTLQDVTHEATWSNCGRYLAVVYFEAPPKVPHRIAIIDFKTAKIRELPAQYALPSFIWSDENMLQFSHVIGVNETIIYGMGKESTHTAKRIADAQFADKAYDLLLESLPARVKALEKIAEDKKTGKGYSGASVNRVSQHIILFAPEFDKPILQPPLDANNN